MFLVSVKVIKTPIARLRCVAIFGEAIEIELALVMEKKQEKTTSKG